MVHCAGHIQNFTLDGLAGMNPQKNDTYIGFNHHRPSEICITIVNYYLIESNHIVEKLSQTLLLNYYLIENKLN